MMVSLSTVLYTDQKTVDLMREECKRVTALGGSFSVRQYFDENWFVEFKIAYPAEVGVPPEADTREDACPPPAP